uniref:STAT_int domain-containing protein n=1 Tax=Haemonchus contortus TaxID=6289 RepID=A0A7I4Y6G2_HAECO
MDLREKLRTVQQQLPDLQRALPRLPSAQELHDNIVKYCIEFHDCTETVARLENHLRLLRNSQEPVLHRSQEAESLEWQSDLLRLRFLFIKSQLRTIFAIAPILVALKRTSAAEWATLMETQHKLDNNKPLLLRMDAIEVITTDSLQTLDGIQLELKTLRKE